MAFNYTRIWPPGYNEMGYKQHLEKRQLFLRSYQFSRKQSVGEKIKKSFFRVKKVIWVRLKSATKFRKMLCFKINITVGLFLNNRIRRRRSNLPRHNYNYNYSRLGSSNRSCFC